MDTVIVAFESDSLCRKFRDLLEGSGSAACLICHSGSQVRRADIGKIDIGAETSTVLLPREGARAMLALEAPIVKDFVVTLSCDGMDEPAQTDGDAPKKRRRRRRRSKKAETGSPADLPAENASDQH